MGESGWEGVCEGGRGWMCEVGRGLDTHVPVSQLNKWTQHWNGGGGGGEQCAD